VDLPRVWWITAACSKNPKALQGLRDQLAALPPPSFRQLERRRKQIAVLIKTPTTPSTLVATSSTDPLKARHPRTSSGCGTEAAYAWPASR